MIRRIQGVTPQVGAGAYVDEAAVVIGRVTVGARSSIWPHAVLRGDTDTIQVGEESNIQDGAVLHADAGVPCSVGDRVTVGHRAIVHGCRIDDEALVGMGAIVMNHARIGAGCLVAAGAVVPEGMQVAPGHLVRGMPARVVRPLTDAERDGLRRSAAHYVDMIGVHRGR